MVEARLLPVEEYARIRRAHGDRMSIRATARGFHHSRRKILEVLRKSEPKGYACRKPAPKLDPVKPIIDRIMAEDEAAQRKQRHTMAQIFRRLVQEHEQEGRYDQVRRYLTERISSGVASGRRSSRWSMPQAKGQSAISGISGATCLRAVARCRCCWSPGRIRTVRSPSRCPASAPGPFCTASLKVSRSSARSPRELSWDNPTTVARAMPRGRKRKFNDGYLALALASHYDFEPLCCMPAGGNKKRTSRTG